MPESNAAAKRRTFKANRAAGLGDESGRLTRVKEPPKMSKCTVCQLELKITKTNTELTAHATSKHGSTLDACFPGASAVAAELAAGGKKGGGSAGGPTKKQQKAKNADDLDDLLSAGLSAGAGKKRGKK
ncbi:expressed unknown protein [Seminavis robusta]|uniref:Uncharacterized protein n=1 Tax=Seminavis robusta TaxID=568900 RepID=A0A9N8DME8_9STRA|nr:expressed unknown protein [Seminavis robusta]|eukprot:Sro161_g072460.1 n/a (129) ;mRNA; r:43196-43655